MALFWPPNFFLKFCRAHSQYLIRLPWSQLHFPAMYLFLLPDKIVDVLCQPGFPELAIFAFQPSWDLLALNSYELPFKIKVHLVC